MQFRLQHRVSFSETDAGGLVHFSQFQCWAEEAEHQFLEAMGFAVLPEGGGGWPRVKVSCEYQSPARYGDEVEVQIAMASLGRSSITWSFSIYRDETLLARGEMVSVRVSELGSSKPFTTDEVQVLEAKLG